MIVHQNQRACLVIEREDGSVVAFAHASPQVAEDAARGYVEGGEAIDAIVYELMPVARFKVDPRRATREPLR